MYCYCRCRCLCFCGVVVELHTRCICVCVELKCYSGASRSNRGGNELGGGGGGGRGGLFQSGLLCPCKLNFMYVCVCTPVNLYYTFIFMICIHLCLLFSSVCVCMFVRAFVERERATMDKQYNGASVYNLGGNSGSFWIVTTMPM